MGSISQEWCMGSISQEQSEKCNDKNYVAQTHLKRPASIRLPQMFLNYSRYKALLKEAKLDTLSHNSSLDGDVSTLSEINLFNVK